MGKLAVVVLLATAACGRIGYDELTGPPIVDGPPADTPTDTPTDTPAGTCPVDTRPVSNAVVAGTCIEITERGNATWVVAKATCEGLGRRLCGDAEWLSACTNTSGLADMAGGVAPDWEWMADLVDAITAKKRGLDLCTDESSHEIDNGGYDFRCCVDL